MFVAVVFHLKLFLRASRTMELSFMVLICLVSLPLYSSQTCTSWSIGKDFNTISSTPYTSASTIELCKAACLSHSTKCANGFNWIYINDNIATRCFISTSLVMQSASGYSHYACPNLQDVITTAAPQTNPSNVMTTQAPNSGPKYAWIKTANSNSPGGNIQSSETSLQMCQDKCLQMKESTCKYGLDYNNNAGLNAQSRCYFAISSNVNVNGYPGVDHYMYQLTAPECTWIEAKDKGSPGGNLDQNANTLDSCKAACKAKNLCQFGFDFNEQSGVGGRCFISTSIALTDYPGVNHYTESCKKPCLWDINANKNTRNGLLMGKYDTVEGCQNACFNSPIYDSCKYGVDFRETGVSGQKCWFSTTSTLHDFTGVNHYVPKCDGSNIVCNWVPKVNMNSPSGSKQTLLNTLDECKLRCKINKDTTCKYGFDYVETATIGNRCWFSTSSTLKNANNVNHYNYECNVVGGGTASPHGCTLDKKAGKNTRGGTAQTSVTTFDMCKANCISKKDTECQYGFDWNQAATPGYKCWFGKAGPLNDFPGVDHYDLVCGGSNAGCTWSSVANKNTRNGVPQQGMNTIEMCKNECLAKRYSTCFNGFDWNGSAGNNQKCWFSTTSSLQNANGIMHYTFSCGGLTTGGSNFLTTMNPVTGLADFIFTEEVDMNSPQGKAQTGANTLSSCKALCVQQFEDKCKYGFDYNPNNPDGQKCWFSSTNAKGPAIGVTHYTPVKQEKCTWVKVENSNTNSGNYISTATTLELCQSECLKVNKCDKGFDWNLSEQKCYISTTTTINTGANGIDHYSCPSSGATSIGPQSTTIQTIGTTTLPASITCNWVSATNTNSPGGDPQIHNILSNCQVGCILTNKATNPPNDPPCPLGIDWDPSMPDGLKCFFSTSAATQTAPGVTHLVCAP